MALLLIQQALKIKKIILIFILCCLTNINAYPYNSSIQDQLQFKSITIDNGLSNNTVHAITQDSIGYMWFATSNGINRFDGYNVTHYKQNPNDSLTILSNSVRVVFVDSKNNLWVGDNNGLSLYNRQFDNFREFQHPQLERPIAEVCDIIEDKIGKIWISALSGVYAYNRNTSDLHVYCNAPDDSIRFPSFVFSKMFVDSKNNIWFSNETSGLFKLDQNTQVLSIYNPSTEMSITDVNTECVYEDRKGRIWVGTYNHGLNTLDSVTGHFREIVPDANNPYSTRVRAIWEDKHGRLYVGTRGGLYQMNPETERFIHYAHDYHAVSRLSHNSILSHFIDRAGVLWIGTYAGGVNYADLKRKKIIHYQAKKEDRRFLNAPNVYAITEDVTGNLWIGTEQGLNKLDKSTQLFTYFTHDPANSNSISYNDIKALESDADGNIWIGTNNGGLDRYNIFDKTIKHFIHDPGDINTLTSNKIYDLYMDTFGKLWIIAGNTVESGRNINLMSDHQNHFIHFDPDVYLGIAETRDGNMWFGATGGVWHFDRKTEVFSFIQNDSLLGRIYTLMEDSHGNLWIGNSKGLTRYHLQTKKFRIFNDTCIFPFYSVYGILEDDYKNLWISTSNGFVKFINAVESINEPRFQELRLVDGIQSRQFNFNAWYKSPTGKMYFGGINGFNTFHPNEIAVNPYKPNVDISNLRLFNEKVLIGKEYNGRILMPTALSSLERLVLSHRDYVFSLEFSAFHYAHPQYNQFTYMLKGFEKDWNYLDVFRRQATYTNLPAGHYTFLVKAANYDGVWNEQPATLSITVLNPWWKTGPAYLIYILLAVFILYSIWRFQLNRRALRHELMLEHQHAEKLEELNTKLEELNAMKSRFFSNITHEFRSPLTLIMGPIKQFLLGETKESFTEIAQIALRNSERMYQLVNQLLELSRLEAGRISLNIQKVEIVPFVEKIVLSYTSLAESKKIDLQFSPSIYFQTNPRPVELYIDIDKIQKVITNLLSNALKFTAENGYVRVSIFQIYNHNHQEYLDSEYDYNLPHRLQSHPSPGKNNKSQTSDPVNNELHQNGYVEICVKDSGVGIREEDINKTFERFYQVNNKEIGNRNGFGIGLALAKELVELHSGVIQVESVYEKGTSFFVRLPIGKDHLHPNEISDAFQDEVPSAHADPYELNDPASDSTTEIETEKNKKKNIPILLIIDDNSDIRKYVADHLKYDYQIVTAKDGEEGLAKAVDQLPDLIVSDVVMPNMDGIELCTRIKKDEFTCHIPVILLTVRSSGDSKIKGLEIGADDYMIKPFEIKELKVRIRNLIEQRRQLKRKYNHKIGLKPSEITTNSIDERFLIKALSFVEANISESTFGVEELAIEMSIHRVHLNRKIRAITGQTAAEFIRSVRLNRAAQLLKQNYDNIAQIAYDVGFHHPSYFSSCFYKQYGIYPSEYIEKTN